MLKYFFLRYYLSLNNFKNLQNYSKSISAVVVSAMILSIIISISIPNGYAAPKEPRNDENAKCSTVYDKKEKKNKETCCWREMVPGKILGNTYCQTCDSYSNNCGDKVLQNRLAEQTKPLDPLINNDIVTENPTTLEPSSPTSSSGMIVTEPLQQMETNDDSNKVDGGLSEDSQSNSDDVSDTDTQQESDVSENSEEFTNSNSKDTGAVDNEAPQ